MSNPVHNASGYHFDNFLKQDSVASPIPIPIPSSISAASRSTPWSVTVPGNTTSYTFLDLLPDQMHSLQVPNFSTVENNSFKIALKWKAAHYHAKK